MVRVPPGTTGVGLTLVIAIGSVPTLRKLIVLIVKTAVKASYHEPEFVKAGQTKDTCVSDHELNVVMTCVSALGPVSVSCTPPGCEAPNPPCHA